MSLSGVCIIYGFPFGFSFTVAKGRQGRTVFHMALACFLIFVLVFFRSLG